MKTPEKTIITVRATISAPVEKVWKLWTDPEHIIHWNNASDDWHTPRAENDLRTGGRFLSRMEAKDGSSGFDFSGKYLRVELYRQIEYTLDDGRNVQVVFFPKENITTVTEAFEAEETNTVELQKSGWQSILDNFKEYTELIVRPDAMHFEVNINSNAEKVYQTMLDIKKYSEWTSVFNPMSHFKGSWNKGSKILFLGTDKDGSMVGMVSRIRENIPNRFLSIEHIGIIEDCKEIYCGPKVDLWAGALENYSFSEDNGKTLVSVDQDVKKEYRPYFEKTWPEALIKLKEICER